MTLYRPEVPPKLMRWCEDHKAWHLMLSFDESRGSFDVVGWVCIDKAATMGRRP